MKAEALTARELDILRLLSEGHSDREIAAQLVLSVGTVKWYNKQIFSKLRVNNRVQATLVARELKLITAPIEELSLPQLPLALTSFIGREENIRQVCALLEDQRLVTIVGPGGVGKTRLAVEVARHIQKQGRLTPCFVPLAAYSQPEAVPQAIASSLGITLTDRPEASQQLISVLLRQPSLLILDNFEHLIDATSTLEAILQAVPDVRLLVTSRERLNLYGEMVYLLEGLAILQSDVAQEAVEFEAVALFVDRARHANATFQPSPDEHPEIARICHLLQGMPLAIEHAASWTHVLDLPAIIGEIQHGIDILSSSMRGIENRHQSMRAVIDYSWERLTLQEQHALMRLSIFRGGFTRDAAEGIAQADLDIVSSLLAKSFVSRIGSDRYDLHEIHRQYAFEKLGDIGETAATRKRHAHFFAELVQNISPRRYGTEYDNDAMNRLDEDYANLRESILWSLYEDDGCLALKLLGFGAIFLDDRGHKAESNGWIREALKRCPDMNPELRTRAYIALIDTDSTQAEYQALLQWAIRSEQVELIADAHRQAGIFSTGKNAYSEAEQHYEKALELYAHTEATHMPYIVFAWLGRLAEVRDDPDRAFHFYVEAWKQAQIAGIRAVNRPLNLGRILLRKGEELRARELYQTALDNAVFQRSPTWVFAVLYDVAVYLQDKGDLPCAVQLFAACYVLAMRLHMPIAELDAMMELLRENMGEAAFNDWWLAGKLLSTADAIGLAQQALEELG